MKTIEFTVDAALLRELGERLVGRPYIALAELVKNSYDADATEVELRFGRDSIEIADNGNGMSFDSFRDFWMRIGSPHKEAQQTSREFGRPLTGSKGVGRLAVQLLANRLELHTVDRENVDSELTALVNWSEAVSAPELTRAKARWTDGPRTSEFPKRSPHGTRLILSELQHDWLSDAFTLLARELWTLEPPFQVGAASSEAFHVSLHHPDQEVVVKFEQQMKAVLDLWSARIVGKLLPRAESSDDRTLRVRVLFRDGTSKKTDHVIENCAIDEAEYEVRVFSLRHRQPFGISVTEARQYLRDYGGVGVYDAGFRLPYYGADSDWLDIARDAGRRLSRSELLPEELLVTEGLQYLPTNERLFGVVNVNTSHERRVAATKGKSAAREALAIQVTRDRLADNRAYHNLVEAVRFGIDLYANEEAARAYARDAMLTPVEPLHEHLERVEEVLEQFKDQIPPAVRTQLSTELESIVEAGRSEATDLARQAGLLGALATAGIATLAYEHETSKQLALLEDAADRLRQDRLTAAQRREIADDLERWVARARATRNLFGHLVTTSEREERARLRARRVVQQVAAQVRALVPSLVVDVDLLDSLRLPPAAMAEWAAIFQNLFLNAANAMLDIAEPRIWVHTGDAGNTQVIWVEDVGTGVDLETADELFRPFVRRQTVSAERQRLGMGGTGLGLAIVRMVARQANVRVRFVEPDDGYSTCVELAWKERG
ncbi:MAG: hypothetical protein QOK43_2901 [Acidimicrobiaceae bacterium]|nr:hypothetical protein [Acidimicrobiaceae bacterium]